MLGRTGCWRIFKPGVFFTLKVFCRKHLFPRIVSSHAVSFARFVGCAYSVRLSARSIWIRTCQSSGNERSLEEVVFDARDFAGPSSPGPHAVIERSVERNNPISFRGFGEAGARPERCLTRAAISPEFTPIRIGYHARNPRAIVFRNVVTDSLTLDRNNS